MPQIREQIAMVHLPPSKTLKYLFHVRKTKEEASNSSSSRMSSRLCIDLGMPFRASPFRFSDGVFCVLRRFKPEEVSSTLRAFLWLKTAFRAF